MQNSLLKIASALILLIIFAWFIIKDVGHVRSILKENPIALNLVEQREKTKSKAQMTTLNHLIPSFDKLIAAIEGREKLGAYAKDYINYYERLVEYFPDFSDGYAVLGYCYYELGDVSSAIKNYQKSIALVPVFFWSNYNLGLIHFREGQFEEAMAYLSTAILLQPEVAAKIIGGSKVFGQILGQAQFKHSLEQSIRGGYHDAQMLLAISFYKLKRFNEMKQVSLMAINSGMDQKGEFYFLAGLSEYEMKNYESTFTFFYECLKRDPQHLEAIHYLAQSFKARGELEKAQEIEKKQAIARQMNPTAQFWGEWIKPHIL